ncbi:hypothetical protein VNO77_02387 [Canavalia gladiata]|uniref:Uncharacterized protein n=1 Tax=Canavalia gladiata TaxID=3824 RepID=A0AAN9R300_CANGL
MPCIRGIPSNISMQTDPWLSTRFRRSHQPLIIRRNLTHSVQMVLPPAQGDRTSGKIWPLSVIMARAKAENINPQFIGSIPYPLQSLLEKVIWYGSKNEDTQKTRVQF